MHTTEERLSREVPTHLFKVEEKVFGLTIPQLLTMAIATTGVGALWYQLHLPLTVRLALIGVYAILAVALIFGKKHGYPLTDWLYLSLRFLIMPGKTIWYSRATAAALAAEKRSPAAYASVQDTWMDVLTIEDGCLGFRDPAAKKRRGKRQGVARYCVGLEVTGINVALYSVEAQARVYDAYQRFLNGLEFPLQVLSRITPIDSRNYEPLLQLEQQMQSLRGTPRLATLAQQNLRFLRQQLAACMQVRHFVIVSASAGEELLRGVDGKRPNLLTVLFTFAWMRKRRQQSNAQVKQQARLRAQAVQRGLSEVKGLQIRLIADPDELADLLAASFTHGVPRSKSNLRGKIGPPEVNAARPTNETEKERTA